MHPFERPIRDLVLKRFLTDFETLQPLDDKDYFTTALNRYVQRRNRDRDMYRETLDDLVDAVDDKRLFSRFPPKYRHEGKYYIDCWRKGISPPSRIELYRLRKSVLWELFFCEIVKFPRWPWQRITIINPYNLKRLRVLIAEFEDRCLMELQRIESRIEYDDVKHKLMEYSPRGEPKELRDFMPGKPPEKFLLCLFAHEGMELSYKEVYEKMKVPKKDRRIPRWKDEQKLDEPDISGKYIYWIGADRLLFTSRHFSSLGRQENMIEYPFSIPKPGKIERIEGAAVLKCRLLFMGMTIRTPLTI